MICLSATENVSGGLRQAGMDGRHPDYRDASGDIHVGLDSSTPCWNDTPKGRCLTDRVAHARYFQRRRRSETSEYFSIMFSRRLSRRSLENWADPSLADPR